MSPTDRISDTSHAEHYSWGSACDGWHLLKQADLSVIQERVPPGAGEVRHVHARARQFFFVLSGTATLEFDSGAVSFGAGQGVHVEPGVAHRFANHSPADVEFLVISTPPTSGDRTDLGPATDAG
ncbi:cupin domain-containing protein [Dokdonella immobilis]|uniref:Mannose-6-phosphate isomerase, cupin superfamily n=1 Tax=Dokdonella immobilis TaxID=578942 RepID=A0A1I4YI89_9GAMM|nr:cupin domain-containing protein [Dokdonella immobilis]SFN37320.1 Mannose-6-phosphate isomerase, cupin superfamily [Dokdonella immobilis]